ncbi:MAG: DMT family transporter [Rhodospirillaceae bacterium]|nr:DMT family transporter [Rhodospirillaceae bacterium]MCA8931573.1 DMT family transporter [Rhodospirillaceae bacterium]
MSQHPAPPGQPALASPPAEPAFAGDAARGTARPAGRSLDPAALAAAWQRLPANTRGAAWILLAAAGFSTMAALVKILGQNLPSLQIAFFRCWVGLALVTPLIVRAGPRILLSRSWKLHVGRALVGIIAIGCGFYAFTHLPLATATAFTFTKPLFMIVLAVLLLGEVVRWRRWTATVAGFVGVLVMVRPGAGTLDPAIFISLTQALCIAIAVVLVKKVPRTESNLTILAYFGILSTTLMGIPAAIVWQPMTAAQWGLGIAVGLFGVASQWAIINGYRTGEASAVAPFDYTRLLFASLFGIVLFGEMPDVWTVVGAGIIVAATVYIARREARIGAPAKAGPTD